MYRYRDNAGSTKGSLKRLKHLEKLGKFLYVKGYVYQGRYGTKHHGVLVRGRKGTARFNGFAWGYGGEGPRGLAQLLKLLGVEQQVIEETAFTKVPWGGWDEVGEKWRINLDATPKLGHQSRVPAARLTL
jgi:hypothetical protein